MRRNALVAALFVAAVSASAAAQDVGADEIPSLDLRGFHPPTDPEGSLYLEPSTTPGGGNWNIGAWQSYALRPIEVRSATGETKSVIEHQLSVDYFAGVGITKRLALGVSLPSIVYQSGDDVTAELPGSGPLPRSALGDVSLNAKATLLPPTDLGGFGLATVGRVFLPTGDPGSYVSEGSVRGELRLLGELQLLALAVRATAGARIRASERTLLDDGTDQYDFGHDVPWGIGVTVRPQAFGIDNEGRWRWTIESRGAFALTPSFAASAQSPVLLGASARYALGEASLFVGVEGLSNSAIGNPIVRPVLGIGWAPRFEDEDGDGIEDEEDECPELEEDVDGFEDRDGCPEFDNDDDGVGDDEDQCPAEQEDEDEFEDEDGCADPDNDGDGVPDEIDQCPYEAGNSKTKPGCMLKDMDGDGLLGEADRCPDVAEDVDGFQDEDGCADLDNDGDGVPDSEDACRDQAGAARPETTIHGCPSPDRDGDTYDDDSDKCPDQPEDFNGVDDEDGCADEATLPKWQQGKPLVTIETKEDGPTAAFRRPIRFRGGEVDPRSEVTLRALAQKLNDHPSWIAAVGVRPNGIHAEAQQDALNRSFAIVLSLRSLTYRDSAAESLGWAAVKSQPGAGRSGVGVLLLAPAAPPSPPAEAPAPPKAPAPTDAPAPANPASPKAP